jgi:dTDP-4-amino-4,6-dideoxygalactose transaminase
VDYNLQSPLVLGHIYRTDQQTLVRRLPFLPTWIEKQRLFAAYYSRNLVVDPGMLCTEIPGAFFNRFQYPILMQSSAQCDRLSSHLLENGITTTRPYRDIASIAKAHYGYTGDCPQSERIADTVIVIPCNYSLTQAEVEKIANCINRIWPEIRRGVGDQEHLCQRH